MANGHGGKRPGAGKPKRFIDLKVVEGMAARGLPLADIAEVLEIPRQTLSHRKHHDESVAAAVRRGVSKGKFKGITLLWRSAERGQVAAQIFLLKNIAGWKDLPDQSEHDRKAQVVHIIFDSVTGEPKEDKEKLAPPLPEPPDAEAQDEAEAKALASCRPTSPAN